MFPGSWCDVVDNTSVAITYLDEALNGANLMQRPKAIKLEFTSLQQKKALDLLDLPNRKNVVGCKWIFKYKRYTDSTTQGTISCSRVGIDNGKGFAPLARYNSIRSFLSVSIDLDLEIYHMNTNNHFHNIVRIFDVLPNFPFTTSETMRDYYL